MNLDPWLGGAQHQHPQGRARERSATDNEGVAPHASDAAAELDRWVRFGGSWRVLGRSEHGVTVALCRCDGGEEVDRITSGDPGLLELLAGRDASGD